MTDPAPEPRPKRARGAKREPATPAASPFGERRTRLLASRADPRLVEMALAMTMLDEETDPTELDRKAHPDDGPYIRQLTQHLQLRAQSRAAWVLHGRDFEPPTRFEEQHASVIDHVEQLFRKAMIKAFPPVIPGAFINLRKFEATFAAFVAGELAMDRLAPLEGGIDAIASHGVPDGANLFCFAEAALLFIRRGSEATFWRPTLRSFVCGASFFAANYWTRKKRRWREYTPATKTRTPSEAILSMLDQHYAALTTQQLAGQLGHTLAIALRDEPGLTIPLPTAPEFHR